VTSLHKESFDSRYAAIGWAFGARILGGGRPILLRRSSAPQYYSLLVGLTRGQMTGLQGVELARNEAVESPDIPADGASQQNSLAVYSSTGIARRMKASNSGTVKSVSP